MEAQAAEMPKVKAAIFTNYSNEDFVGVYGRVEYPIKKGGSMMFEGYLAVHFAKQLAQRELNKKDILCSRSNVEREGMQALAHAEEIDGKDDIQVKNQVLDHNSKKDEPVKKVEGSNEAKKPDIVKELEEFEGLKK